MLTTPLFFLSLPAFAAQLASHSTCEAIMVPYHATVLLAAFLCAWIPVGIQAILHPHGFLPRLVIQPDLAARGELPQEQLDSVCFDTRMSWGRMGALPAVDGSTGKDRQGRLCKLQGLVIQRQNTSGELRERLLRVSNLEPAEDDTFTTTHMGNLSMGTVAESHARELCLGAQQTYSDIPVVIMSRDLCNLFHTFGTQLLPLYTALVRFDLQNVRFKLVFVHDWPQVHGEYESRFLELFQTVSGGVRPETLGQLPDVVCAETAVVGLEPQHLFPFSYHSRLDYMGQYRWASLIFRGYVDWILRAYDLQLPDFSDEDGSERGVVLIVTRTAGHSRQLRGCDALAEHARQRGWHVQTMDISTLSIREQIAVVMTASIFISVHGAALTLAAFLPVRAVAVELMPVGFGSPANADFYFGFANWLDVASVSHIVWHDPHLELDPGAAGGDGRVVCGKDAHVQLTSDAVRDVFGAAEEVWHSHPGDRQKSKVWYLNEVSECPEDNAES